MLWFLIFPTNIQFAIEVMLEMITLVHLQQRQLSTVCDTVVHQKCCANQTYTVYTYTTNKTNIQINPQKSPVFCVLPKRSHGCSQ